MATFQIPGLDYDDSDESSPDIEETEPPLDNHMCIDCYSIAMKIVQQPRGTPVSDKYLIVHELTSEELTTFGNALKDSDIDPDGDDFIHCDRCNCYYRASCKEHPLFWVKDREPAKSSRPEDRARMTAPAFISIKTSSIPNAGLGAFAEACIPVGMVFGPYQGILIDDASEAEKDGYCWELRSSDGPHFMDGSNTQYSNWMRYINSSRHDREQNLLAFQYCGGVYYRVIRPIKMKDELLVWYGKKFGKSLGVFTTFRSLKRPITPASKNPFIL
ncbi:hypothetical protein KIN20_012989 [Parelaphostrongylus tenuis]|uniref:SET domain-containing protein n=1 Tax=Parelaphostrongylus tenuis TaxID=148309 RepID=A0AAD5QMB1_PARTN|nr:hypothetical protein KIN20_012989 [Parelaphostrongylus tenuis]